MKLVQDRTHWFDACESMAVHFAARAEGEAIPSPECKRSNRVASRHILKKSV